MNIVWEQGLSYQENYNNLLQKLKEDSKEWNTEFGNCVEIIGWKYVDKL